MTQPPTALDEIGLIGRQLTAAERACGKSKREIEIMLAEIAPKPDVPTRMRKLPEPAR